VALWLLAAALVPLSAAPLGGADGGFENGFAGMTTSGDAGVVSRLGILAAPQGAEAALLTTTPDAGTEPGDATVANVVFPGVAIPTGTAQLRFQAAFLTDEPTHSRTDDGLSVILRNQTTFAETVIHVIDTFGHAYPAPWTGYTEMSGWRSLVADLTPLAGSPDLFTLEFRIGDTGDGRADSAALIDDVRLTAAGLPRANAGFDYAARALETELTVNGLGSTDDGTLVDYFWDFGDGATASGPTATYTYARNGTFQGSLTVTDNDGNRDTDVFTVAVGPANNPPVFTSVAVTTGADNILYSYAPTVADPELPFGDTLTFALTQSPAGMSINPLSGRLAWLPGPASPRSNPVTLTVTDSQGPHRHPELHPDRLRAQTVRRGGRRRGQHLRHREQRRRHLVQLPPGIHHRRPRLGYRGGRLHQRWVRRHPGGRRFGHDHGVPPAGQRRHQPLRQPGRGRQRRECRGRLWHDRRGPRP
jgi:hypothetical protein